MGMSNRFTAWNDNQRRYIRMTESEYLAYCLWEVSDRERYLMLTRWWLQKWA